MDSEQMTRRLREKDADDAGTTRRGRRRKFTREEVHRRLLEVSVAEVVASGLHYGLDAVRLDRVATLAGVPRGAAYELWEDDELAPQDALRRETVLSIVRDMPSGNANATAEIGLGKIAELEAAINSSDAAVVRAARGEVIRAVAVFNQQGLNSQMWRTYRAIVSAVTTQPDPDPVVLAAIEAGEVKLIDAYEQLFVDFVAIFQMVLKPGYTMRLFVMSVFALNDGLTNRTQAFDDQTVDIDGQHWTALALGSEALCDQYFTIALK